jgi:hypothetical protein
MNKQQLDILERAFSAEIDSAVEGTGLGLIQTRSKVAKQLAKDGYLQEVEYTLPGRFPVVVKGYVQTLAGNFAYCQSDRCKDAELPEQIGVKA